MRSRLTKALTFAAAAAALSACSPDYTAALTVWTPYATDSGAGDTGWPSDTADEASADLAELAGEELEIADGWDVSDAADVDAAPSDAGQTDAGADSQGYAEVQYDTVQAFDLGAPADLGTPYDPDIWEELPWQPETAADSQTDSAGDTQPGDDGQGDVAVDAADDAQTDVAVDAADDAKADTDGDADSDAQADAEGDVDADAQADAEGDTGADAQTDAAADSWVDTATDAGADLDSAADAATPCGGSCDDGEPCTADLCLDNGQCSHVAQANGSLCAEGTCELGICSRNSPSQAGQSCLTLRQAQSDAQTGVWWLDPDGPFGVWQPYAAWCDMQFLGGGWTLLIKVDAKGQLGYDSPLWTSIATLNPGRPRIDQPEAKLDSYWSVAISELSVHMATGNIDKALIFSLKGTSLFHLIKDDKPVTPELPISAWGILLTGEQLQSGCMTHGLNVAPGKSAQSLYNYARVRIGVVGNSEADCFSPDSRLGLGGAGGTCGQDAALTSGNAAGCYSGAETNNLPAFGYVLGR